MMPATVDKARMASERPPARKPWKSLMRRFILIIALAAVWLAPPPLSAKVYIWTDENGVKHYSNVEPSESADEIEDNKEISAPPHPTADRRNRGRRPRQTQTPAPGAASEPAPAGPHGTAPPDASPSDSDAAFVESHKLDIDKFPIPQAELVQREKSIVGSLKREIVENGADPHKLAAREKKRLRYNLAQLEGAPLEKFGSQDNKRRQTGYYRYRLEALQNSPDTYFDYAETEGD
jgi:hypothetical protein